MTTLIIGYGSPIRGDDAVGPLLADRIAGRIEQGAWPAGTEVQARHILTAELVEDLHRAARVVFIDAAAGGTPGEIRTRRVQPDPGAPSTMAHFHDPRELLAWCEGLYGAAPEAWLVTVSGAAWDYGHFDLSPTVQAVLPAALEVLADLCVHEAAAIDT
ncbi:MAG: hydrogenase maturation protease [Thiohalocapsa sp.]|jgi:hydrogenase maturation protease|uniref:hydrogenase maturation protease n=1 Tax=Thiohalocapsa sp. TaxID=2497641 RepID=UPI0025FF6004|nr:hydrogenase maturation protease [Thiohalocapsa sp.]MCG6940650.1 hydrogenase maturation protease [Thiohalocapsa sp.]